MSNKEKNISLLLFVLSIALLGALVFNGRRDLTKLRASVNVEENSEVIDAAKKMAEHNIDKIDNEAVYTIEELINKEYLTGNEINPKTNKIYDKKTRVVVLVRNKKIEDVYITNYLFKDELSCDDICYLKENNYISFNNDIYRIIKIDKEGFIYITNNELKDTKGEDIDSYLKIVYNSLDKNIVDRVVNLKYDDIKNSNVIELQEKVVVDTNEGRKTYNVDTDEELESNLKEKVLPVIVLKSELTYEKGDGSQFDPYVLGE